MVWTEEIRAKVSASKRGKPRPDLAERNRVRNREFWANAPQKQRDAALARLAAMREHRQSRTAESRARTGADTRRWWVSLTADERARRTASLRIQNVGNRFTHPPAVRQRIRAARIKYWAELPSDERARRAAIQAPRLLAMRIAMLPNIRATAIENMVDAVLARLNIVYRRQEPIGPYLADFFLPDHRLLLECDGAYWHSIPKVQRRDRKRDGWCKWQGYRVIRLKEHDIRSDASACVRTALGM